MKSDRELLEQALKLVAKYHARETILVDWEKSVIEAINARLNERESSDEPVAWIDHEGGLYHYKLYETYLPLYRHQPPERKLTDEEIEELYMQMIERRINGEEENAST